MRQLVAVLAVLVCLSAAGRAQESYAAVVREYATGDADAAITSILGFDARQLLERLRSADVLTTLRTFRRAAALHTEAAFRGGLDGGINTLQLDVATALVEIGEKDTVIAAGRSADAHRLTPNSPYFLGNPPVQVTDDFRLLWYELVVTRLEYAARLDAADSYLKHALLLFPQNANVRLLAGIGQEMRCSPRVTGSNTCQRDWLTAAEAHFRAAVAAQPDRLEARLRLGRVLQRLGRPDAARTVLAPLASASDDRIAYLGQLFLGGVEDALEHPDAALAAYDAAAARLPRAQTARLAASEVRFRMGDRQAAAAAIPAATGEANALEPWWTYTFGEYWRIDLLLEAIHRARNG